MTIFLDVLIFARLAAISAIITLLTVCGICDIIKTLNARRKDNNNDIDNVL